MSFEGSRDSTADGRNAVPPQFGLLSLGWTVLVIALALAYLRQLDSPPVFLTGTLVVVAALIVGVGIGWWAGRIADAAYWSVILATAAFLSVAGERAYGPVFVIAWSAVGILTGACCGAISERRPVRRMLTGLVVAGITMAGFAAAIQASTLELIFDLLCAPIIGALIAVLIEMIAWLERRSRIPRYITAAWLLSAVIVGNWMVPLVRA